jgi:hypothetical protein
MELGGQPRARAKAQQAVRPTGAIRPENLSGSVEHEGLEPIRNVSKVKEATKKKQTRIRAH